MGERCETCRFSYGHSADSGSCHRFPPVFAGREHDHRQRLEPLYEHPRTSAGDWCGEFQARAVAPIPQSTDNPND